MERGQQQMSIEALLERLSITLEKHTLAIEALTEAAKAIGKPAVSRTRTKTENAGEQKPNEEKPANSLPPVAPIESSKEIQEAMNRAHQQLMTNPVEYLKPAEVKPPEPQAPVITIEQVREALVKVQTLKGAPMARKIVVEIGNAPQVTKIDPAKYVLVLAACEEVMTHGTAK
jgi:hypothetical protein